ncbi:GH3 auxin-responsive promoter [Collybia nuda]|uniref:GH3 auxin-responsive promoter n=1 Tax=Collybia nuda TaxID=64659 RepID=A0A9P5YCQ9_9AGAR|nr:GH3 auxin-responsive promoter [Collybia nuda]
MAISDAAPLTVYTLTPKLAVLLKQRLGALLQYLVTTNSKTIYYKEATLLADFREALAKIAGPPEVVESIDSQVLLETFSSTLPLSGYDDYRPFISRFMEPPRYNSKVSNLFAPGLPAFVVTSSGTSGGAAKYLPKYRHPLSKLSSTIDGMKAVTPTVKHGGTHCIIFNLRYSELLDVLDDGAKEATVFKKIPLCLGSSAAFRSHYQWSAENDEALMATKVPNNTSPLAVCFIHSYRTSLLMHALFALEDESLELINTLFATIFLDFVRLIEEYWEPLLQAINDGRVPDFEGAESVKHHLQSQLKPNPRRATKLRAIGNDSSSPGWVKRLWPRLERVLGNASGMFGRVVPQIKHHLGPQVPIESVGLTSSEGWIAKVYDPKRDIYKMASDDIFEYLELDRPETKDSLSQSWEVEVGKHYELIMTTRDGLWRYRLGDVVEIAGFDPVDGQPLIRYSERRNVSMRASGEFVTEKELQDAIQAQDNVLGSVVEFTTVLDDRFVPRAYGFLVELQGPPGHDASTVPERLHNYLLGANDTYAEFFSRNVLSIPTVRILERGAFRSYREWKTQSSPSGSGQIKVPTVIYNVDIRDWLLERVVDEV